ncbi:MAG: SUMF1/EgtB/PvdO family nonheme iron enzyme, partial [Chloroflexota bacterium]
VDLSDRLAAPLRDEIVTKLRTMMQSIQTPIKDRAAAGEILDALGWLPDDLDAFVFVPGAGNKRGWVELDGSVGSLPTPNPLNSTNSRLSGERGFWIAKYPVTNYQFQRFIDAGGYENEKYWRNQRGVDEKGHEKNLKNEAWDWLKGAGGAERRPWQWDNPRFHRAGYPVTGVTWYEAAAYCAWLTEQFMISDLGFMIDGSASGNHKSEILNHKFIARLPTEAEWVRAAGGEQDDRYPWDAENPKSQLPTSNLQSLISNVVARANVKESEIGGTTPVAMYPDGKRVTETGDEIWDLAGNVWEWTSTLYEGYPGAYVRGGSWYNDANASSVSSRVNWGRYLDYHVVGLRVVVASPNFPPVVL